MAVFAHNKDALFNYELIETYEAGIVLKGWEVKSIKNGWASLKESYVVFKGNDLYLIGCHVTGWPGVQLTTKDMNVDRKLMLHKHEINKIKGMISSKGFTAVIVDLYAKAGKIKAKLAIARGKKMYDKRTVLKEKDQKRDIERDLKHYAMVK